MLEIKDKEASVLKAMEFVAHRASIEGRAAS